MSGRTRRLSLGAVLLAAGLYGAAPPVSAQAPQPSMAPPDYRRALIDAPMTLEAPLAGLAGARPGESWNMPLTGVFYCDGLALVGVTFTRNDEPGAASTIRTFDVVVTLQAWPQIDDKSTDLAFVAVDGRRELILGRFDGLRLRAGATTSFSRKFSLDARAFDSLFALGNAPVLRVTRTTRPS
jgi:hypothetical protein